MFAIFGYENRWAIQAKNVVAHEAWVALREKGVRGCTPGPWLVQSSAASMEKALEEQKMLPGAAGVVEYEHSAMCTHCGEQAVTRQYGIHCQEMFPLCEMHSSQAKLQEAVWEFLTPHAATCQTAEKPREYVMNILNSETARRRFGHMFVIHLRDGMSHQWWGIAYMDHGGERVIQCPDWLKPDLWREYQKRTSSGTHLAPPGLITP